MLNLAVRQFMGPFSLLQNYGPHVATLIERQENYAAYQLEVRDMHGNFEMISLDITIYEERDMPAEATFRELVQLADSCFVIVNTVAGEAFRGEASAKIIKYPSMEFKHRAFQVIRGGLEGSQDRRKKEST